MPPRPAFVVKWNIKEGNEVEVSKIRKISDKGVTCFDVSPDGRFLGFGSSDYTIGILDASTLGVRTFSSLLFLSSLMFVCLIAPRKHIESTRFPSYDVTV